MTKQLISFCAAFSLIGALASAKTPEEQKGYDKSKDLGVKAPAGADTPFDGTMDSIKKNFEMWPKKAMDITWKIVKSPTDDSKVLMTDGGKKWGTHDLITKKTGSKRAFALDEIRSKLHATRAITALKS